MTLVKRHPTIYFRAEKSNMAETELLGVKPWLSVAEAATWPMTMNEHGRCASVSNLPCLPALSVLDVPASLASSGVYVRPRLTSSAAARRACARRARQKSQCDFCRRTHAAAHAGRLATDTFETHAVLRVHV